MGRKGKNKPSDRKQRTSIKSRLSKNSDAIKGADDSDDDIDRILAKIPSRDKAFDKKKVGRKTKKKKK
jgi:hypothetical protein